MNSVTYHEFCKAIAKDYSIELSHKQKTYFEDFPIKKGKKKINSFSDAVIVDNDGNEYPYMLTPHNRNEDKLIDFDYIYITRSKSLNRILNEVGLDLRSEICKISEGGGWYSVGIRYFYKDLYCEI
jgi:hypothetical protein